MKRNPFERTASDNTSLVILAILAFIVFMAVLI